MRKNPFAGMAVGFMLAAILLAASLPVTANMAKPIDFPIDQMLFSMKTQTLP